MAQPLHTIEHLNGEVRLISQRAGIHASCCGFPLTLKCFLSGDGNCVNCTTPITEMDHAILSMDVVHIKDDEDDEDGKKHQTFRQMSLRVEEEANIEVTDEVRSNLPNCAICFTELSGKIVVLPCGNIFCYNCVAGYCLPEKKCPSCTQRFGISYPLKPIKSNPMESVPFSEAIATQFAAFGSVNIPSVIYSSSPVDAMLLQYNMGKVFNQKVILWMFDCQFAMIVKITPNNVQVLHWWEGPDITSVVSKISAIRQQSSTASTSLRQASNRQYSQPVHDMETSDDLPFETLDGTLTETLDDTPTKTSVGIPFKPIIDSAPMRFLSTTTAEDIAQMRVIADQSIGENDQWLVGLQMTDVVGNSFVIQGNFMMRQVFQNVGSTFADYFQLCVTIVDGCITDYDSFTYGDERGQMLDGSICDYSIGIHTGDMRPYIGTPLIVHEVIHSVNPLANRTTMKNHGIKSHAEICELMIGRGRTHIIDIMAAWPVSVKMCNLGICNPSLVAHTNDANGNPIGYQIDPCLHLTTTAVIIGMVELTTPVYHLIGHGINGFAGDVPCCVGSINQYIATHGLPIVLEEVIDAVVVEIDAVVVEIEAVIVEIEAVMEMIVEDV